MTTTTSKQIACPLIDFTTILENVVALNHNKTLINRTESEVLVIIRNNLAIISAFFLDTIERPMSGETAIILQQFFMLIEQLISFPVNQTNESFVIEITSHLSKVLYEFKMKTKMLALINYKWFIEQPFLYKLFNPRCVNEWITTYPEKKKLIRTIFEWMTILVHNYYIQIMLNTAVCKKPTLITEHPLYVLIARGSNTVSGADVDILLQLYDYNADNPCPSDVSTVLHSFVTYLTTVTKKDEP